MLLAVKKKHTVGDTESKPTNYMPVILVVGAVVVLGGLNKLLQALGIEKSTAATALQNSSSSTTSPWNPNYYKNISGYVSTMDQATADADATAIYKAFGLFDLGYDIGAITGVIHSLTTQAQLSQVADSFNTQYGKDLFTYLYTGGISAGWTSLSTDEMTALQSYVSQLPAS